MRSRTDLAVLLAAVLAACGHAQTLQALPLPADSVPSLYDTLSQTVVRLETRRDFGAQAIVSHPVGTGFLVEQSGALFLVTARHVVEAIPEVRVRDSVSGAEFVVPRPAWVFHPAPAGRAQRDSGEWIDVDPVDVAVARLPVSTDARVRPLLYCRPLSCSGRRNQLALRDPEPSEPVLTAGHPSYLTFELRRQRPLLRFGRVAMAASEPYLKDVGGRTYVEARARALDLRTFPGDSGAPVFADSDPGVGLLLVGMILGGDTELGFTIAEPVSRVIETLELAAETQVPPAGTVRVHRLPM